MYHCQNIQGHLLCGLLMWCQDRLKTSAGSHRCGVFEEVICRSQRRLNRRPQHRMRVDSRAFITRPSAGLHLLPCSEERFGSPRRRFSGDTVLTHKHWASPSAASTAIYSCTSPVPTSSGSIATGCGLDDRVRFSAGQQISLSFLFLMG